MSRLIRMCLALAIAMGAAVAQPRVIPKAGPVPKVLRPAARKAMRQNLLDYLMSMQPRQQQEFMRSNPRFRALPTRQQEGIRNRLEQINGLPAARREALRERYELFQQLPPERQDRARSLYARWVRFPQPRRQEMRQEFRTLRDSSPEERRQRLVSQEFRDRFGTEEQDTLRGLVELLPPD